MASNRGGKRGRSHPYSSYSSYGGNGYGYGYGGQNIQAGPYSINNKKPAARPDKYSTDNTKSSTSAGTNIPSKPTMAPVYSRPITFLGRPAPTPAPTLSEPCAIYTRTGRCEQPGCRYKHIPGRTAVCQQYMKTGRCAKPGNDPCYLSHSPKPENAPMCVHFARQNCTKRDCEFAHMTHLGPEPEKAPICRRFALNGWCDKGAACSSRHSDECPDFAAYGKCATKQCPLAHVKTRPNALSRTAASFGKNLFASNSAFAQKTPYTSASQASILSLTSRKINVAEFVEFLKTATRESCAAQNLPAQGGPVSDSEHSSSEASSNDEIDDEPLDVGADFIKI